MIFTYLCRHGMHGIWIDKFNQFYNQKEIDEFDKRDELVIHYHGKTFLAEDLENWTVILNYRNDLFAQYCSHRIASYTNQYTYYDKIVHLRQIRIDIDRAVIEAKSHYDYRFDVRRLMLDHRPWKNVIEITHEEIGANYQGLFKRLPIAGKTYNDQMPETSKKSLYDPKRFIYNFEATKKIFREKFYEAYGIKL